MKTKLLKKIRKKVNRRYTFVTEFRRDESGQIIQIYKVFDNDEYCERDKLLGTYTDYNEAWGIYRKHYISYVLKNLDEIYKMYNKSPKSLIKKDFNETQYKDGDIVLHNGNACMKMNGENKNRVLIMPNPPVLGVPNINIKDPSCYEMLRSDIITEENNDKIKIV